MVALASRNTIPFIEFHSSYKIMLRWKKTKCTKARHENPYKQTGGKREMCAPDQAEKFDSRGFRGYYVKSATHKYVKATNGVQNIYLC